MCKRIQKACLAFSILIFFKINCEVKKVSHVEGVTKASGLFVSLHTL